MRFLFHLDLSLMQVPEFFFEILNFGTKQGVVSQLIKWKPPQEATYNSRHLFVLSLPQGGTAAAVTLGILR